MIALVGGARAFGLGERPIDAESVREELRRKNCYDGGNFAQYHLGPLEGFNAGADHTEIKPTSKWDEDFRAAIDQALDRTNAQDKK